MTHCLSLIYDIHTDQRPSLKQDTIIALMTMKFNSISSCYNSIFTKELLDQCKKATYLAVRGPGPEEQPDDN